MSFLEAFCGGFCDDGADPRVVKVIETKRHVALASTRPTRLRQNTNGADRKTNESQNLSI
jgi:hypothetical protein